MRHIKRGVDGRTAVALIGFLAVPGDGGNALGGQVDSADSGVFQIAEVQRAVRSDGEPVRIIDLGIGKSRFAGADEGGHRGGVGSADGGQNAEKRQKLHQ